MTREQQIIEEDGAREAAWLNENIALDNIESPQIEIKDLNGNNVALYLTEDVMAQGADQNHEKTKLIVDVYPFNQSLKNW